MACRIAPSTLAGLNIFTGIQPGIERIKHPPGLIGCDGRSASIDFIAARRGLQVQVTFDYGEEFIILTKQGTRFVVVTNTRATCVRSEAPFGTGFDGEARCGIGDKSGQIIV